MRTRLIRNAIVVGLILMVPLVAMQFTSEVNWDIFDFAFMGTLLFGTSLAYELVARKVGVLGYRSGVLVALTAGVLLVWVNGAVGIIGDEDVANALYVGIPLAVGLVGSVIARFRPDGMARTLIAMALAQASIALIAVSAGWGSTAPIWPGDILIATGFFVALWVASALLFRKAARASLATSAG